MSSSVGVWAKVLWIATALNLWIRTDKRWNRKVLSRWSLDSWEYVPFKVIPRLLSMNSTNETLLFNRFLIMYNLCVFTCVIFICISLNTCANVICTKLLLTYLLTYLLSYHYHYQQQQHNYNLTHHVVNSRSCLSTHTRAKNQTQNTQTSLSFRKAARQSKIHISQKCKPKSRFFSE